MDCAVRAVWARTVELLRNTSGQLAGGYAVGIGPYAGSIENLQNHPIGSADMNTVCGDTTASCVTYVTANLADPFYDTAHSTGSRINGRAADLTGPFDGATSHGSLDLVKAVDPKGHLCLAAGIGAEDFNLEHDHTRWRRGQTESSGRSCFWLRSGA